jgi:N-methylhydantoinase A
VLLGVDVGGTFTDAVLVDEHAVVHTAKVPSTPARESLAVMRAVEQVLARAGAAPGQVTRFAHGMTVATNALLQGNVARTALIATAGFTDVIELARQTRAHLYDLARAAPAPLVPAELRFAARERNGVDGPLLELDPAEARALVAEIAAAQPQAVAVALLHSYAHPAHEQLLGALLAELAPDAHVSLSSDLVGTFREYERTATTALDAALSPLLASYLDELAERASASGLVAPQIMQSSGGLTDVARASRHAALTVLSGPAGGVGGALALAELAGESHVLCLDMGGTSCDVCVIGDRQVAETAERTIAGRPLALPALDIHTVGAGGGSIAWRDPGGALRVGPQSAGADPGPACYGRHRSAGAGANVGEAQPTVTDANLLLGRLAPDAPLAGGLTLDRAAAREAVGRLARQLGLDELACAEGIVRVAEAEMLGALRLVTVQRGIDPRDFALMAFGGAGPLHATALARQLQIEHVLCPRASGVLCALGLAAAAPRRDVARTVLLTSAAFTAQSLHDERTRLLAEVIAALGEPPARVRLRYELRYRGQSFELAVDEEIDPGHLDAHGSAGASPAPVGLAPRQVAESFAAAHQLRYGYRDETSEVELVTIRASAWGPAPAFAPQALAAEPPALDSARIVFGGEAVEAAVWRGEPPPGSAIVGPALCALGEATLLVEPGWAGEVDRFGTIHLHRREAG